MAYAIDVREKLAVKLRKLRRKDFTTYKRVIKKVGEIKDNPYAAKPLQYQDTAIWRIHVGSFVLTYTISEQKKTITLVDFEHHDAAYN